MSADAVPDAASICADDLFGPSAPGLPAASLGAGRYGLVLCDARPDRFSIDLPPGVTARVEVRPEVAGATVDVALWAAGVRVAGAVGSAEMAASLAADVGAPGLELVVTPEDDKRTPYLLLVDTSAPQACGAGPDAQCLEGVAHHTLDDLGPGQLGTVCVEVRGTGQVLLALRCATGAATPAETPPVAFGRQLGDGELCRTVGPFPEVARCEALLLAPDTAPVAYVSPAWRTFAPVAGEAQAWRGRATLIPEDALPPPVEPTFAGVVSAVASDGTVSTSAFVRRDSPDFEFDVYAAPGSAPARALAASTVVRSPEGRETFIVVAPGQAGAPPWMVPLPATGEATEASTPEVASAHVAAVLADGVARLDARVAEMDFAAAPPPTAWLQVRWGPGRAEPCGTCFEPAGFGTLELSGRPGDPDAWDDDVILHELGHWAARRFGRDDSPGGAHDGSRVAGAIAYSEGFADFHAAWQRGGPTLVDRRADGARTRDLETMSEQDPLAMGTSDGTTLGLVSERFVSSLLWDLLDAPPEDDESVAVDERLVLGAAFAMAARWTGDRGPAGFDLVDYLDALSCVEGEAGRAAAALATARGFAYEAPEPPNCPVRSGE